MGGSAPKPARSVRRSLSPIIFCVVLGVLLSPTRVCAADVPTLYGVQFPVEEVAAVDAATVGVTIGSETEIISREMLGDYAARKILENPSRARRLTLAAVEQFFRAALEANDKKRLAWAMQGLGAHFTLDEPGVSGFLAEVGSPALMVEVCKAALLAPPSAAFPEMFLARIFLLVGPQDPRWAGSRAGGLTAAQSAWVRETLREQILAALQGRDFKRADELLLFQQELVGEQDPGQRDLRVFASRLAKAVAAIAADDAEPAFALAAVMRSNNELYPLTVPVLLEAAHRRAQVELDRGAVSAALLVLARIDFERRTPQTHELTLRALAALPPNSEPVLGDARIAEYLAAISAVDERIKQRYLQALEAQVQASLASAQVDTAVDFIRRVVGLRPDPSEANDALRYELVHLYTSRGNRQDAGHILSEIQTGVGPWRWVALAWSGYFGSIFSWVGLLLGGIAVLGLGYLASQIQWRPKPRAEPAAKPPTEAPREDDDDKDRPAGFSIVSSRLLTPAMLEYHRSLEGLGLKPGTSLAEIKKRYRSLVKKVHPDLNQNLTAEEKDRFIALTKIYDRILELRSELHLTE